MATFTLEWRQFRGDDASPVFLHRLSRADSPAGVARIATDLDDAAWRREFRVARGGRDVFTDLHAIGDWPGSGRDLPAAAVRHLWREHLRQDLAADHFLDSLTGAAQRAVAAEAMSRADADTLVRFARGAVRRPRL